MRHRILSRQSVMATTGVVLGLVSVASANHSSTFSDFDTVTDPGWSSMSVTMSPFWPDGNFLGEFGDETVSLFIMNALPTGPDSEEGDRLVTLELDLLVLDSWLGPVGIQIIANGSLIFDQDFSGPLPLHANHLDLEFPLFETLSTDIFLEFRGVSVDGGTWGLDNVLVDWSQPLPSPAGLALLALAAVTCRRRRRSEPTRI